MEYNNMFYVKCGLSALFGIFAFLLIINQLSGWGWFIFLALCSIPNDSAHM